jgi:hypothetical protein
MKSILRRKHGAAVLILEFMCLAIIVSLLLAVLSLHFMQMAANRNNTAVEAAALAAAADLGRIVVNDPYYGYIGLVDAAPCCKDTVARDGEPLPVLGINTIVANARLIRLVADTTGSEDLRQLAARESIESNRAAKLLEGKLKDALNSKSLYKPTDAYGNALHPCQDADAAFKSDLQSAPTLGEPKLQELTLSLGWINTAADSKVGIPLPVETAQVASQLNVRGNYRAFASVPLDGNDFYFAGFGSRTAALVNPGDFRTADGKRISSAVKASAVIGYTGLPGNAKMKQGSYPISLKTAGCALPQMADDIVTSGVLEISFPHGFPKNIKTLQNLLTSSELSRSKMDLVTAANGDFPGDNGSHLIPTYNELGDNRPSISMLFAQALCSWLKNSQAKTHLDSLTSVLNTDLRQWNHNSDQPLQLMLDFGSNGEVSVRTQQPNPFPINTVFENQTYAYQTDAFNVNGVSWSVVYRNFAEHSGTVYGGKHGGQPLSGNPVNWCELPYYGSSSWSGGAQRKGSQALGVSLLGDNAGCDGGDTAISTTSAQFISTRTGRPLPIQPRKSWYSGGLVAYLEISDPRPQQ